jgi:hypothetical protein
MALQRDKSTRGHVDIGTREKCFLKLGDSVSGVLPTAGIADRLTGDNGVPAHEFSVERIECGCGVAVYVERADEFLLPVNADDQQRNRQTRAVPESLRGLNEFRSPVMIYADYRAHRTALSARAAAARSAATRTRDQVAPRSTAS